MKRAIINIQLQAHELKGGDLRELIPKEVLDSKGVPISTIVHIDGENEEELCRKIREWLSSAKTI